MADNWAAGVNGSDDEDEDLRIAIALSLGQDPGKRPGGPKNAGTIDLTQDDDTDSGVDDDGDGDDAKRELVQTAINTSSQRPAASEGLPPPSSGLAALGIDRKKMEEERLARLGKRKAAELGDAIPSRPVQRPRIGAGPFSLPNKATTSEEKKEQKQASVVTSPKQPCSDLPFPRGVVKKTWAYGQPRQGDDIKIEEVLQKHQLQLAVLSSFQWDEEWMLSKIDVARTKLILIAFATSEAQVSVCPGFACGMGRVSSMLMENSGGKKEEMRNNVPRDRIRFCFPPMQPMGSMHSKLQLLRYETYLRIVVPTGNLMSYDWGETGTMENVWVSFLCWRLFRSRKSGTDVHGGRWCSSSISPSCRLPNSGTPSRSPRLAKIYSTSSELKG
jgi:hypothetical protein